MAEMEETKREREALAGLLRQAIAGSGLRQGPSTDPEILARRLMESERVRVDVPGRRTIAEQVELALRCGRAEKQLGEERWATEALSAEVVGLRAELAAEQERAHELEAALGRACAAVHQDLGVSA